MALHRLRPALRGRGAGGGGGAKLRRLPRPPLPPRPRQHRLLHEQLLPGYKAYTRRSGADVKLAGPFGALEVVSSRWRVWIGGLFFLPYALGYASLAAFAYWLRDWRVLHAVICAPPILAVAFIWSVLPLLCSTPGGWGRGAGSLTSLPAGSSSTGEQRRRRPFSGEPPDSTAPLFRPSSTSRPSQPPFPRSWPGRPNTLRRWRGRRLARWRRPRSSKPASSTSSATPGSPSGPSTCSSTGSLLSFPCVPRRWG